MATARYAATATSQPTEKVTCPVSASLRQKGAKIIVFFPTEVKCRCGNDTQCAGVFPLSESMTKQFSPACHEANEHGNSLRKSGRDRGSQVASSTSPEEK